MKFAKTSIKLVLHIIAAAVIGMLLMIFAFMINVDKIDANVAASAGLLKEEGTYPVLSEIFKSRLDNYTDALMMMEAADDSSDATLIRAINVYNHRVGELSPSESIAAHYLDGMEYTQTSSYPRYWHGYLIILKPLLCATNYSGIRVINTIMQLLLLVIICGLLYLCSYKMYIIPYVLSYLMLRPVALSRSMQYSSCYYVFSIAIIVMLIMQKTKKLSDESLYLFLYSGIATAYLDYLTYPMVVLTIVLTIYLTVCELNSVKYKILSILKNSAVWSCGYLGMWSLKWVIASFFTSENVIVDAISTLKLRTSSTGAGNAEHISKVIGVIYNVKAFLFTPVIVLIFMFALYVVIRIIIISKRNRGNVDLLNVRQILWEFVPYLCVALIPMGWYAVTTNHSYIHTYYTNKACVGSLLAVLCGMVRIWQLESAGAKDD